MVAPREMTDRVSRNQEPREVMLCRRGPHRVSARRPGVYVGKNAIGYRERYSAFTRPQLFAVVAVAPPCRYRRCAISAFAFAPPVPSPKIRRFSATEEPPELLPTSTPSRDTL